MKRHRLADPAGSRHTRGRPAIRSLLPPTSIRRQLRPLRPAGIQVARGLSGQRKHRALRGPAPSRGPHREQDRAIVRMPRPISSPRCGNELSGRPLRGDRGRLSRRERRAQAGSRPPQAGRAPLSGKGPPRALDCFEIVSPSCAITPSTSGRAPLPGDRAASLPERRQSARHPPGNLYSREGAYDARRDARFGQDVRGELLALAGFPTVAGPEALPGRDASGQLRCVCPLNDRPAAPHVLDPPAI